MRMPRAVSRMRPEFGPFVAWAGTQFAIMLSIPPVAPQRYPLSALRKRIVAAHIDATAILKGALCHDLWIESDVPDRCGYRYAVVTVSRPPGLPINLLRSTTRWLVLDSANYLDSVWCAMLELAGTPRGGVECCQKLQ